MTDYFALLNEPRRPWLDSDFLKQKFLSLSAESHPDRVHNASQAEREAAQQRYTGLNAAYNCLRDHKARLLHLLELECGAKPKDVQNIPAGLMDLFLRVREVCQRADALLAEKAGVTSPLLQVQMFERAQETTEALSKMQQQINSGHERLIGELKNIDAAWSDSGQEALGNRTAALQKLEELYRLFSYFARWSGQIQERILQLSF